MKLRSGKNLIAALILLVVFAIIAALWFIPGKADEKPKHISMIVYGDDTERWENIREGAYLVCSDNNAKLSLLTMLSEYDADEQMEMIDRELEDGTDALIIAPCSSSRIKEYIDAKKLRIPVVYLETIKDASPTDICIALDDYEMGYALGEEIVAEESDIVTIAVLSGNTDQDCVRLREQGLRDAIDGKVGKIIDWSGKGAGTGSNARTIIQKNIVSEATDVIVSFDNNTTDALLDALDNLGHSAKVYSISTSNKAVYNLYNQGIKVLEYPDEFSMGYLAAMYALDPVYASGRYSHKKIEYRMVRKENMYDEENQTLLFPFVD